MGHWFVHLSVDAEIIVAGNAFSCIRGFNQVILTDGTNTVASVRASRKRNNIDYILSITISIVIIDFRPYFTFIPIPYYMAA